MPEEERATTSPPPEALRAAALILECDGLVVSAGAGMGIDSGLPDFRGPQEFLAAYPAIGKAGLHVEKIANPTMFEREPRLACGFYGHQLAFTDRTCPTKDLPS